MPGLLGWIAGALGALAPVSRYVVVGTSMEPAYADGDRLLVNKLAYRRRRPRAGDVVVLRDPDDRARKLIKRVAAALPQDIDPGPVRLYVLGDNAAESRDSRHFGLIHVRDVVGRVWFRY